jgi:hypothetical protein
MNDTIRPERPRLRDELGLPKTLPAEARDFATLFGNGGRVLLLGLGPRPDLLPELLGLDAAAEVRFIECPEAAAQLGQAWRDIIPAGWREFAPQEAPAYARGARVILYRPAPRLFPGFYGPVLARLALANLPQAAPDPGLVWIPGGAGDLLRRELAEGFEALGLRTRSIAPDADPRALLARGERPALYFSVNFQGIDPLGETAHLLTEAGARVAVWCVDNPLHLLSGLRARFWTELPLFVTDDWFVPVLRGLGAEDIRHLPLAARAGELARDFAAQAPADLAGRLVFVGRSAFPGKAEFFAGCKTPAAAWTEAQRLLDAGSRPDFGWWLTRLGVERLWPGADARRAGFCAEETGRAWRAACLTRACRDLGGAVTVFGDAGWRELLPDGMDLREPVDYYGALPGVCAGAAACLNCTSPLLPHALTQRHFDVWAWGGLLVSDATPGLDIFPQELTRPITFARPEGIAPALRALLASADAGAGLKAAWRGEIAARHTYAHRARAVLKALGLG